MHACIQGKRGKGAQNYIKFYSAKIKSYHSRIQHWPILQNMRLMFWACRSDSVAQSQPELQAQPVRQSRECDSVCVSVWVCVCEGALVWVCAIEQVLSYTHAWCKCLLVIKVWKEGEIWFSLLLKQKVGSAQFSKFLPSYKSYVYKLSTLSTTTLSSGLGHLSPPK